MALRQNLRKLMIWLGNPRSIKGIDTRRERVT